MFRVVFVKLEDYRFHSNIFGDKKRFCYLKKKVDSKQKKYHESFYRWITKNVDKHFFNKLLFKKLLIKLQTTNSGNQILILTLNYNFNFSLQI